LPVECSGDDANCVATRCCKEGGFKCYQKNETFAKCKASCTLGLDLDDPLAERTPWSCKILEEPKGPWRPGLRATHFWDCNGAGCDSTTLSPWIKKKYIYAPQYAPLDPHEHGGAEYGEKMWLTGAASDTLAELLGTDASCCGKDTDSGACGRCVLVRNPTAIEAEWTAVVMKKSRCPPESNQCEAGKLHMDIAVPGYDVLTESTANVCGSSKRADTYLSALESSTCGQWYKEEGTNTKTNCDCSKLVGGTAEQRAMRQGCEIFTSWGWTSGDPTLEYQVVECPKAFEAYVQEAFTKKGVKSLSKHAWHLWILGVVVLLCAAGVVCNWVMQVKEERKRQACEQERLRRKRRKQKQQANGKRASVSSASDSDIDSTSSSD